MQRDTAEIVIVENRLAPRVADAISCLYQLMQELKLPTEKQENQVAEWFYSEYGEKRNDV